jgi:hypothetical protein
MLLASLRNVWANAVKRHFTPMAPKLDNLASYETRMLGALKLVASMIYLCLDLKLQLKE